MGIEEVIKEQAERNKEWHASVNRLLDEPNEQSSDFAVVISARAESKEMLIDILNDLIIEMREENVSAGVMWHDEDKYSGVYAYLVPPNTPYDKEKRRKILSTRG